MFWGPLALHAEPWGRKSAYADFYKHSVPPEYPAQGTPETKQITLKTSLGDIRCVGTAIKLADLEHGLTYLSHGTPTKFAPKRYIPRHIPSQASNLPRLTQRTETFYRQFKIYEVKVTNQQDKPLTLPEILKVITRDGEIHPHTIVNAYPDIFTTTLKHMWKRKIPQTSFYAIIYGGIIFLLTYYGILICGKLSGINWNQTMRDLCACFFDCCSDGTQPFAECANTCEESVLEETAITCLERCCGDAEVSNTCIERCYGEDLSCSGITLSSWPYLIPTILSSLLVAFFVCCCPCLWEGEKHKLERKQFEHPTKQVRNYNRFIHKLHEATRRTITLGHNKQDVFFVLVAPEKMSDPEQGNQLVIDVT